MGIGIDGPTRGEGPAVPRTSRLIHRRLRAESGWAGHNAKSLAAVDNNAHLKEISFPTTPGLDSHSQLQAAAFGTLVRRCKIRMTLVMLLVYMLWSSRVTDAQDVGTVTTLAGTNFTIGYADGPAVNATFNRPHGIAMDPAGTFALVVSGI